MEYEVFDNELEEEFSDDSLFNITSYGVDLSIREIISMYDDGDLEKPELQRKYVWNKKEASRFIDSILLGLPIPSLFFAKTADEKRLIVDGYQRIMTIYDYIKRGFFSNENKPFKLSNNQGINVLWRNKSFTELPEEFKRKIRNYSIHAIIFEQKEPKNDSGMYQIFERINTSGRALKPQEIRNCVYHGKFNKLLIELNTYKGWRKLLNSEEEDKRMFDMELILRFFAILKLPNETEILKKSQINLTYYLNQFMADNSENKELIYELKNTFYNTVDYLVKYMPNVAFRTFSDGKKSNKINTVMVEDLMVSTAIYLSSSLKTDEEIFNLEGKYIELFSNAEFIEASTNRTTNKINIEKRISKMLKSLFGLENGYSLSKQD